MSLALTSLSPGLAQSSGMSLSVTQVPPKLPADGGTYPALVVELLGSSNKPAVSTNDTTIFLTSSQQNVGTVPSSVILPAGHSYVLVNFTTTTIAGTTSVTASSTGIASANTQVQTVTPSGFPTHIQAFPVPPSQIAQPLGAGAVVVELVDDTGLPAKAVSNTNITLSSANTAIASFPVGSVIVPSGAIMALSTYQTGLTTGSTTITASASGFYSGTAPVSVVGVAPLALHLYLAPPVMPSFTMGQLVVSLTDMSGNPARAPSSIPVTVTADNTSVASVPSQVTIPAGSISVVANYTAANPGTATITVSAQNLAQAQQTLSVYPALTPLALQLTIAPNPILADSNTYQAIYVSLMNGQYPAKSVSAITVNLSSQNLGVGNVTSSIVIPAGANFAVANFTSTFFVGTTAITAQASGYSSATLAIQTFGPIPAQVRVNAVPVTLPADGGTYTSLAVSLVDAAGLPAIAPIGITVQLSASNPDIATAGSSVTIPAGSTAALTTVTTTLSPGSSTITATATGYGGSSVTINTVQPGASKLGIYVAPVDSVHLPIGGDAFVAVQIQDANGNPARARLPVSSTVTSSSSAVLGAPITFNIPVGGTYAMSYVTFNDPGSQASTATLTASAAGLSSSTIQVTVEPSPLSIIPPSTTEVQAGSTSTITLTVQLMGEGLQGASVTWTSTNCVITPTQSVTASSGVATAQLSSCNAGSAVVTATVTHPAIGTQSKQFTLQVIEPKPQPTFAQRLFSFPYVLILVAIVVVVALVVLIIIRRRQPQPL
jgi:hypothetical protein